MLWCKLSFLEEMTPLQIFITAGFEKSPFSLYTQPLPPLSWGHQCLQNGLFFAKTSSTSNEISCGQELGILFNCHSAQLLLFPLCKLCLQNWLPEMYCKCFLHYSKRWLPQNGRLKVKTGRLQLANETCKVLFVGLLCAVMPGSQQRGREAISTRSVFQCNFCLLKLVATAGRPSIGLLAESLKFSLLPFKIRVGRTSWHKQYLVRGSMGNKKLHFILLKTLSCWFSI